MSIHRSQTILLTLSATVLGLGGFLGLAGLSSASPAAQEQKAAPVSGSYQVDAVHSAVIFRIKHIETSLSFGRFNAISGDLVVDEKSPEKSSVKITIEMDSVDTANQKRNDHLKSPDFFEVREYPKATFESTKVVAGASGKATITGKLVLHGVTKEISFPATVEVGEKGLTLTSEFSIDRTQFGMTFGEGKVEPKVSMTVIVGEKTTPK